MCTKMEELISQLYEVILDDDDEQKHRLYNRDKSDATKLAWKRHHHSYMSGVRKRERDKMNKTLMDITKELNNALSEAELKQDNVFDKSLTLTFNTLTGGIALSIDDKTKNVSISTILGEHGSGNYALTQQQDFKILYDGLKEDLTNLCDTIDKEMEQILAKHGLRSTK